MTSQSIAAFNAVEQARHNVVVERHEHRRLDQDLKRINEEIRHNQAYEAITKQGQQLQYNASIYASKMHYAGSVYSANKNYQAAVYTANKQASTQRYLGLLNAQNQMSIAQLNANTAKYAANKQYSSSIYNADMHYASSAYSANKSYMSNLQRIQADRAMNAATNQTHLLTTAISSFAGLSGNAMRAFTFAIR